MSVFDFLKFGTLGFGSDIESPEVSSNYSFTKQVYKHEKRRPPRKAVKRKGL
jgi:hypothetical protein